MREVTSKEIWMIGKIIRRKGCQPYITTITGITDDGEEYCYADTNVSGSRIKIDELEEKFEIIGDLKSE